MRQLIKYLVFLFIASLPLENIISIPFFGSITSLIGILIFFIYIIDSLKIKKKSNYPLFFKIYSLLLIYVGISLIYSEIFNNSVSDLLTFTQIFIFLTIFYKYCLRSSDLNKLLIILFISIFYTAISTFIMGSVLDYSRVSVFSQNQNEIAVFFVVGVQIALYFLSQTKSITLKIFLILLMFLLIITLINTGSRTGAIALGAVFLYYIYSQFKVSLKNFFGLAFVLFIISLPSLSGLIHIENINRISESKEQIEDGNFTGRGYIWAQAFTYIEKKPFFGYGIGTSEEVLARSFPNFQKKSTHNTLIQLLFELGIFGLIIFIKLVYISIKESLKIKNKEKRHLVLSLIVMILIFGLTLALFRRKLLYVILVLPFVVNKIQIFVKN
jgi:O-antigen ligase